ncbi:hypothetical protein [Streptomyces cadmiisoli]|uniref:hypothetical protein n=1 Tax=Streptomyces cadmiisoli TaxID=2184053 RepID=UPI00364D062E
MLFNDLEPAVVSDLHHITGRTAEDHAGASGRFEQPQPASSPAAQGFMAAWPLRGTRHRPVAIRRERLVLVLVVPVPLLQVLVHRPGRQYFGLRTAGRGMTGREVYVGVGRRL